MKIQHYRLFGGMLLVSGSCIGAGMLALPIVTGLAGFFPSMALLALACAFMTFTSLLLLEMNSWFSKRVNLLSMMEIALGKKAKTLCFCFYLFLFYSLLVAYISASGQILSTWLDRSLGLPIPESFVSASFVFFFGIIVFLGTGIADVCNRFLMAGLGVCFFAMVGIGLPQVELSYLQHMDVSYLVLSLPVLVLSFGFQNMIPSLSDYLDEDWLRVRKTILGGSALVFFVYALWQLLLMGLVPFAGSNGIYAIYSKGQEASVALNFPFIGPFAKGFAFFAIVTSFLAQSLTLMHFLEDGLQWSFTPLWRFCLTLITLVPPLVFAVSYPHIFYQAIGFAGGICAVILFGIFPILAVWSGRYKNKLSSSYQVWGGKASLCLAAFFAIFVLLQQIYATWNAIS